MFAKKITESDAFLDMPSSTQMLYFHLSMNADDDGFVNNPKKIQRMCGASDDDFKLLIAKSFVILFESGVIVIKHWKMHNYIQSDRYRPTDYVEEKSMLGLKKNKAYTLDEEKMDTRCIQDVSVGKVSKGKDSIGKDSIDKYSVVKDNYTVATDTNVGSKSPSKPSKHKYGEYQHVLLTDKEFEKLSAEFGDDIRDKAIRFLDEYIEEKGYKSKSHNLAIRRWVIDAVKEQEAKNARAANAQSYKKQTKAEELDESYRMMADWADS